MSQFSIKPGNFFLNDRMELKLGDFGFAIQKEKENQPGYQKLLTCCGSPNYISPEVAALRNKENKQSYVVDFQTDYWSLGIILYTLLTGKPPFQHNSQEKIFEAIENSESNIDSILDNSGIQNKFAKKIIRFLLRKTPRYRPALEDLQKNSDFVEFMRYNTIIKRMPSRTQKQQLSEQTIKEQFNKLDEKYTKDEVQEKQTYISQDKSALRSRLQSEKKSELIINSEISAKLKELNPIKRFIYESQEKTKTKNILFELSNCQIGKYVINDTKNNQFFPNGKNTIKCPLKYFVKTQYAYIFLFQNFSQIYFCDKSQIIDLTIGTEKKLFSLIQSKFEEVDLKNIPEDVEYRKSYINEVFILCQNEHKYEPPKTQK